MEGIEAKVLSFRKKFWREDEVLIDMVRIGLEPSEVGVQYENPLLRDLIKNLHSKGYSDATIEDLPGLKYPDSGLYPKTPDQVGGIRMTNQTKNPSSRISEGILTLRIKDAILVALKKHKALHSYTFLIVEPRAGERSHFYDSIRVYLDQYDIF